MYLEIDDLLTPDEVAEARALAERGTFEDGLKTVMGGGDHGLKHNEQMTSSPGEQAVLDRIIGAALGRSAEARAFTQSIRLKAPMLSRYTPGMHYGAHLDAPIFNMDPPMRSDLSMTVFLSDPESYEGGALLLETDFGEIECRLPAGSAVIYSTLLWHQVEPVTAATRLAVVTWFQSRVRDPVQREMIYTATLAANEVSAAAPESAAAKRLNLLVANMTRLWSEV